VSVINRNVSLRYDIDGCIFLHMTDPEFEKMCDRWGGKVNVKISKPSEVGSENQNRLMHGLMTAFFLTGMHSSPAKSIEEFKLWLKCQIGVCYDYEYCGKPCRVPASWSVYDKTQRMQFIDSLISMVLQSGAAAEDEKIQEILNGMETNGELKRSQQEAEKTQGGNNG